VSGLFNRSLTLGFVGFVVCCLLLLFYYGVVHSFFLFGKRVDCFISVLVPRQLWTHGKMKVYQKYPLIATIYILINWNTKQGKKKPLPLQI